jgi:hypothetical protein
VYLPVEVIMELERHGAWQVAEQVRGLEKGLVFPSTVGGYRVPVVLKQPLQRCCARAGIAKRLTSHCLLVTTNNLVRQAAGDAAARAMVGHATPGECQGCCRMKAHARASNDRDESRARA